MHTHDFKASFIASFKKKIEDKTVVLTNVVDPNKVIENS